MPNDGKINCNKNDELIKDDNDFLSKCAYAEALGSLTEKQRKEVSRLEFSAKTKRVLAQRVGYRCSNPECKTKTTIGPGDTPNSVILLGEAAHIVGAIQDGKDKLSPRSDSSKTASDITSLGNGIWLCRNCHKLVDSKTSKYTIEVLKGWKKQAEEKQSQILEQQPSTFVEDYIYPSINIQKGISTENYDEKEWCLFAYMLSYRGYKQALSFEKDDDGNDFQTTYLAWMSGHSIEFKTCGIDFDGDWENCGRQIRAVVGEMVGVVKINNYGLDFGQKFDEMVDKFYEEDDEALGKLIKKLSKT